MSKKELHVIEKRDLLITLDAKEFIYESGYWPASQVPESLAPDLIGGTLYLHETKADDVTRGTAAFRPISTAMMLKRTISGGSQLARVFGQLLCPASLLAQCWQADGATLLTSETSAGDSPRAN